MFSLRFPKLLLTFFLTSLPQVLGIPDCSAGLSSDGKQLTNKTYTGCFIPEVGQYVASVNYTYPWVKGIQRECWWDLYNVNAALIYTAWKPMGGPNFCQGSSPYCQATVSNTTEQCYAVTTSISNNNGPTLGLAFAGASIEDSTGQTYTVSVSKETCSTVTVSKLCSWADQNCHTVCVRHQALRIEGYKLLRCNSHTQPRPASADYTVCMQDFVVDAPIDNTLATNCDGTCDALNPCQDLPAQEPLLPFDQASSCQSINSSQFSAANSSINQLTPTGSGVGLAHQRSKTLLFAASTFMLASLAMSL